MSLCRKKKPGQLPGLNYSGASGKGHPSVFMSTANQKPVLNGYKNESWQNVSPEKLPDFAGFEDFKSINIDTFFNFCFQIMVPSRPL